MELIDAHAHVRLADGEVTRLLARMDELGIGRTVVVGGGLLSPHEIARRMIVPPTESEAEGVDFDNAALLQACAEAGGRLLPFFFANTWRGVTGYRAAGASFAGLKLGPVIHGMSFSDERLRAFVAVAGELKHPVYLHCLARPGVDIADLCALAAHFPEVSFIMGHGGIGHMDLLAIDQIAPHANISFETSGSFSMAVKAALKTLGAGRVLFGSEYPLQDPQVELVKIRCLDLNEADFAAVTGGNIARLVGRTA